MPLTNKHTYAEPDSTYLCLCDKSSLHDYVIVHLLRKATQFVSIFASWFLSYVEIELLRFFYGERIWNAFGVCSWVDIPIDINIFSKIDINLCRKDEKHTLLACLIIHTWALHFMGQNFYIKSHTCFYMHFDVIHFDLLNFSVKMGQYVQFWVFNLQLCWKGQ